jgi:hypothetical protein
MCDRCGYSKATTETIEGFNLCDSCDSVRNNCINEPIENRSLNDFIKEVKLRLTEKKIYATIEDLRALIFSNEIKSNSSGSYILKAIEDLKEAVNEERSYFDLNLDFGNRSILI